MHLLQMDSYIIAMMSRRICTKISFINIILPRNTLGKLPLCHGFFEFVHNGRDRYERLLDILIGLLPIPSGNAS
jgi:hypothetical protein